MRGGRRVEDGRTCPLHSSPFSSVLNDQHQNPEEEEEEEEERKRKGEEREKKKRFQVEIF